MTDPNPGLDGVTRNPLSMTGAAIAAVSAAFFLTAFLADLFGLHVNPYLGIIFFLVIPALFVGGLLMIPLGIHLARRREAKGLGQRRWLKLDLNVPTHRRTLLVVLFLTVVNLLIVSLAAFRGIEYMDSPSFCGEVCHEVMEPEYTAYQDGPHSRVPCVDCHIGPGAPWFVKAKLDGTRQVIALMLNSYSRPVPSPVHELRPARDTCEQCHWPEKFHGDKMNVRREYADDEAVSESAMNIRVHIGGGGPGASGIHWHVSQSNQIEYIATDAKREEIGYVRLTTGSGEVREYFAEGTTPEKLAQGERRIMDCIDCHNRPTHPFSASPARAVDAAITGGDIPRTLPYVRREAVGALSAEYPTRAAALEAISAKLTAFYRDNQQGKPVNNDDVARAIRATQRIYGRNVFPEMRVAWGTHPNHIGHTDSTGCFRCHDETKKTKDGKVISQDCSLCHDIQ